MQTENEQASKSQNNIHACSALIQQEICSCIFCWFRLHLPCECAMCKGSWCHNTYFNSLLKKSEFTSVHCKQLIFFVFLITKAAQWSSNLPSIIWPFKPDFDYFFFFNSYNVFAPTLQNACLCLDVSKQKENLIFFWPIGLDWSLAPFWGKCLRQVVSSWHHQKLHGPETDHCTAEGSFEFWEERISKYIFCLQAPRHKSV